MPPMLENLLLAGTLIVVCVLIHFGGLLLLMRALRLSAARVRRNNNMMGHAGVTLAIIVGLLAILSVEIWIYALTYLAIGAIPDLKTALYFSVTTFSTVGYGDVVLHEHWRLFGSTEAVTGLIMFGWSTAFLFSIMSHMRAFEHHWLDEEDDAK